MFIYLFEHPLFKYQYRKLILSFPITDAIRKAMNEDGYHEIALFEMLDRAVKKGENVYAPAQS